MATLADELLADLEDEEEDIEDELIAQESGLILELFWSFYFLSEIDQV